jgi:hypothetical protein
MLADTAKGMQKGSHSRPHAFGGVGADFTNTLTVVIVCPSFDTYAPPSNASRPKAL